MLRKLLPLILALVSISVNIKAQVTPPCPTPPPPGAESCATTCVYCNFDGYMGINNGTPSGGSLVCGQITIHNDQWFGFVAGTTSITIDILPSNCQNGEGLQAAFFDNCTDDAITCNAGNGVAGPLTLSYSNFVPGQTYYLMIDGWVGDVCNYEIMVTDGSVTPPPPSQPPVPQGPAQVCPGATVVYSIPPVDGAGYYRWTSPAGSSINGGSNNVLFDAPDGTEVTITFGATGGQVCVQTGNACFPPLKTCLNVVNQPIPPTIKPPVVVCADDLPYIWDEAPFNSVSLPGTYTLTSSPYDSYLGCDSTVKQTIIAKQQIKTNIGLQYICEGSCLIVNGNSYCTPGGPYQETYESYQGCDSVIQFTIAAIPAVAVISTPQTITCTNPTLVLNSNGSSTGTNVTYTWTNASWNPIGNQPTQTVNTGGDVHLIVTNTGGSKICKDTATVNVPANNTLPGATALGGMLTCLPNGNSVTLMGSSQATGVNYSWTGPGITPANKNLQNPVVTATGTYVLTVTNPGNGCTSTATATVTANNTPPSATATGGTINCAQPTFIINGGSNGITPTYVWSGPGINAGNMTLEDPPVTVPGIYSVTVTDAATGCSNTTSTIVDEDTTLPTVSAGADQTITCVQNNVTLTGSGSPATVTFNWAGPAFPPLDPALPNPSVNLPGTYILTVTNPANGCVKRDTVIVGASLTPPTANAGADQTITCTTTSVILGGAGSSQGTGFQAAWTGPGITAGNASQYNPTVSDPGPYTLTVTNLTNGCTTSDAVTINLNVATPTANAGADQTLTCTTTSGVTLSGSGNPSGISYLWSGPGIGANNENLQNPQVSQPGNYVLQVTDPVNGCTGTDQVEVFQDANVPAANAGPDLKLDCQTGSVDINAAGSASGPDIAYTWTGPGITPTNMNDQSPVGITLPGTYHLTVKNTTNSCENTDVLVITIDTIAPVANAGADLILNCYNNGADTLNASASSTGANFTYNWSGAGINAGNQTMQNPVVLQPGNYSLTVTNTQNHCTSTDQAAVADDQVAPTADAGADQIINCVVTSIAIGGNSSAGANFKYAWIGPGINAGNETQAQPTVGSAGNYQIVVTNTVNGCTATDAITVVLDAIFPTASAGNDLTLTCASPTQALDGSASSAGPDFQTQWAGPGINAGNSGTLSPSITLPGTYILTITNTTNSCKTIDTVLVMENKVVPAVSAGPDQRLDCQTTSVILDGSGSSAGTTYVYLWNGQGIQPGTEVQQSPSVAMPGIYSLLVTDTDNGCTATDEVEITQDIVVPVASAGVDITLTCAQSTLGLDGSASSAGPNFEYLWQGPGINTSNFNVQNPMVSDSGTYVLLVTNTQNHCTATDQVYADKDGDFPATNAGPDQTLTCQNDTLQLDGSASLSGAGIVYAWSGPGIVAGQASGVTPGVFAPGAYTLTVTNTNNGCSATDIVNVGQDILPPIADAGIDQTLTCATSAGIKLSAAASNTGPGFALLWGGPGISTNNQNLIEPIVSVPGTYTVTITNTGNGCTNTDEVVVDQDQNLPTASAGIDQTITCATVEVALDGSASASNGTLEFLWAGPGINATNQKEQISTVNQPGIYTLTVTNVVTGCTATDMVEVFLDNMPAQATATGGMITCTNLQITLSSTSSIAGSLFSWSGPDIDLGNMNLQNPPVEEPGAYTVVVTAPNGCTSSATAVVDIDANVPTGSVEGTQLNCSNNGQSIINGTVDTPGATFSWTGPNGFTSGILNPMVSVAGTYVFTIVSANGCKKPYEAEVTADFTKPTALASVNDQLDCSTTSLTINGAGTSTGASITYAWSTNNGSIVSGANTLKPVVDAPGQYTLLVTNILNGCTNSTTVDVEYDPSVPTGFNLGIQHIRCFGELNGSITVNSVNGGTQPFVFSLNGGTASGTAQFTQLGAGDYTIMLEDAKGCTLDTVVSITAPGALQVALEDDLLVQLGASVTVTATVTGTTPVASITWNPPTPCPTPDCLTYDTLPTHSYLQGITVVDINGCRSVDQQLIQVDRSRRIYVPNIINPSSNDPFNAQLMVQGGTDVVRIITWQIFDRWGNAIFSQNDFQPNDATHAWNGKARGDDAPMAVYVWYLKVEFIDGEVEQFQGDVTLIRN